jgi:hypothetical protein
LKAVLWVALFVVFSGGAGFAEKLHCKFPQATSAHFIPAEFDISLDQDAGRVVVRDHQFDALSDAPMFGKISTTNQVRRTLTWFSPMITSTFYATPSKRSFVLEFRLTLPRGATSAILTYAGVGLGFYGTNEAEGRAEGQCWPSK